MNWKKLLKDKSGLTQGAKFLLTTAGVGGLAIYTIMGATGEQVRQEQNLRAISSLAEGRPYAGVVSPDGMLSSINVRTGRGMATAKDREAMERRSASSTNFGMDGVDQLNQGSIGQAAQFYDSGDGVGMGGDKGTESAVRFANGASSANFHGNQAQGAGQGDGQNDATASRKNKRAADGEFEEDEEGGYGVGKKGNLPTLNNASMAQASGSSSSSTYNPANPSGTPVNGTHGNDMKAYEMSGAMPDGSTLVSSGLNDNNQSSRYSRGYTGKSNKSVKERSDLRQITKQSAADANDKNGAVNKGGRAFLLGGAVIGGLAALSNALSFGSSSADLTTSNSDVNSIPPEITGADYLKARTQWVEERDNKVEKAKSKFMGWIIAAAAALAIGSLVLVQLKNSPDIYSKGAYIAAAIILGVIVASCISVALWDVGKLLHEQPPYGIKVNNAPLWFMMGCGGALAGLTAYTAIWNPEPVAKFVKNFVVGLVKSPLLLLRRAGEGLWNKFMH